MISILGTIFGTATGRIVAAAIAALVALKAYGWQQQHKGATNVVKKIEKSEKKQASKVRRARNSSRANGGVYDPYTRPN